MCAIFCVRVASCVVGIFFSEVARQMTQRSHFPYLPYSPIFIQSRIEIILFVDSTACTHSPALFSHTHSLEVCLIKKI